MAKGIFSSSGWQDLTVLLGQTGIIGFCGNPCGDFYKIINHCGAACLFNLKLLAPRTVPWLGFFTLGINSKEAICCEKERQFRIAPMQILDLYEKGYDKLSFFLYWNAARQVGSTSWMTPFLRIRFDRSGLWNLGPNCLEWKLSF